MAAFDYTRARATAERLLARFGQAGSIRRTTTTGGDAWNPGSGTTTTTGYDCTVALLDYKDMEIDGTRVVQGDRKAYISTSGLSITPSNGDQLRVGSVDHAIVDIKQINPAGTVVVYMAQVRR